MIEPTFLVQIRYGGNIPPDESGGLTWEVAMSELEKARKNPMFLGYALVKEDLL